ncbi:class D sortase [Terribacillus saccharophilus]|uniref:class D sortase n=1 Tax=Terribacillus saccharophilus TaxID=361277 RepID=UPI0039819B82
MKKLIGLTFLFAGIILGIFTLMQWNESSSSAKEFDAVDKKKAEAIIKETRVQEDINKQQSEESAAAPAEEEDYPTGEKVAMLSIPKIEKKFSVFWGTDEDTLTKGVGMMESDSTTTPAGKRHTVLSGHRDTVFVELGELVEGDHLLVTMDDTDYTYEITDIWITDDGDRSVIVPKETATLTLTTCYPFDFIGHADQRYIIQGELIGQTKA